MQKEPHLHLSSVPPAGEDSFSQVSMGDLSQGTAVEDPQIKRSGAEASRPCCCQGDGESGHGLSSSSGSLTASQAEWELLGSHFKKIHSAFATSSWVP